MLELGPDLLFSEIFLVRKMINMFCIFSLNTVSGVGSTINRLQGPVRQRAQELVKRWRRLVHEDKRAIDEVSDESIFVEVTDQVFLLGTRVLF